MSKCLVVLTFIEDIHSRYRKHLGIGLIKPDRTSDEIINLIRVGSPDQIPEEVYGVNSMLEQLPMLGVEVVYEYINKATANKLFNEAKKLKIIYEGKAITLAQFLKSRKIDYEIDDIYACKKNVYDDVCLISEKLGLPSITKDEFSLIAKKMKQHENNSGMYSRAVLPYPLDFESRYIAEDLDWD